ncbi:MAG: carbohydrate ABC transporter permease [Lentisphaerae bacterium]|jgi:ABC-type glycerol-3-phosphate transport system permease component|nr:carbohydrate ABC transporter permease [Lentisphaerota bacterium]MBT4814140.1 carbohydrate ABC transporter permease [Lentisphaerota bacterium]MBT5607365.1 carbohydrate ABC transporter permease [Lentisphaerota bacterium]MBT7058375.1 carbohydrate ABC transporter permease [Lentisphaerota bacterium]MBT7841692.1 carbohydrate ABC transporter permease [Lentisphaerota bacterium]
MNTLHACLLALICVFAGSLLMFPRRPQIAWTYLRYVVLVLAAGVVLTPFAWLLCAAFKDRDILMEYVFLPPVSRWSSETLNLNSFRQLFAGEKTPQGTVYFWRYILNSLFLTTTATVLHIVTCSLTGYALAKYSFRGRRAIMLFMLGSMMIPSMILLAPVYQLMYHVGWIDTYLALLIPGAVPVFGVFLFRQAIVNVPNDLLEAARIDGCSEFGIYWNVVMPLVRPMTGAFCLVSFLGAWNSFLGPQIYIHTQAKLTLPVVLSQYIGIYNQQYGVFLAGTLLAILPPAIIFFGLQREFVSGLTSGAVKG